jgi:hypothetical protein
MSCARCSDLCVTFAIRVPADLTKAISIARENIADGTLVEVEPPSEAVRFEPSVTLAELAAGAKSSDLVNFRFRCTSCGEEFLLDAETYHGSGGSWRPHKREISGDAL